MFQQEWSHWLHCGASGESGRKVAADPLSKTAAATAVAETWLAKLLIDYMPHNTYPWKRCGRRCSVWPPYSLRRNLSAAACRPCDHSLIVTPLNLHLQPHLPVAVNPLMPRSVRSKSSCFFMYNQLLPHIPFAWNLTDTRSSLVQVNCTSRKWITAFYFSALSTIACFRMLPMYFCYTPRFNEVERGVYWFHLIRLSVCGQNSVRSVSSTILIGSISYLHI